MVRLITWITEYIVSVLRIGVVFLIALFVPRVFIYYIATSSTATGRDDHRQFKLGLENISPSLAKTLFSSSKGPCAIGLVTNHTGKDQHGNRNIDILINKGLAVKAIFTPKHGFNADKAEHAQAYKRESDAVANIPMVTWGGGQSPHGLALYKALLNEIDVLVFDIQDSGLRYGYAVTLLAVMKTAHEYHKKVVVLDRPNMLGSSMEGALLESVATNEGMPIPMRHGMTTGELAHYFNKHVLCSAVALHVVPMHHYDRHDPRVASASCTISPNITNLESCYGCSFVGLLGEIGPFDIGVGTEKAFQCLMLPEKHGISKRQWYELSTLLKEHGIQGRYYRCFNKRKKQFYNGLKIRIEDINHVASFTALLAVAEFFKTTGVPLTFSDKFDTVVGTNKMRGFFEGTVERKELEDVANRQLTSFFNKAMNSFIYKPLPHMVRV